MNTDNYIIYEKYTSINKSLNVLMEAEPNNPTGNFGQDGLNKAKKILNSLIKVREAEEKYFQEAKNANLVGDQQIQQKRNTSNKKLINHINFFRNKIDPRNQKELQEFDRYIDSSFKRYGISSTSLQQGPGSTSTNTSETDAVASEVPYADEQRVDVIGPGGIPMNVPKKTADLLYSKDGQQVNPAQALQSVWTGYGRFPQQPSVRN